jgi:hypothetical protein
MLRELWYLFKEILVEFGIKFSTRNVSPENILVYAYPLNSKDERVK